LYRLAPVNATHQRPLGTWEILDVSLKLAANNAGTLVRIVLCVIVPAQLLTSLIMVSAGLGAHSALFGSHEGASSHARNAQVLAVLISFLAGQLATAASFRAIADAYEGRAPSWRESLQFFAVRFRSVLLVVLLGFVFTLIGVILFIVPGIYLAIALAVAVPVLLDEGKRGRDALRRSRELVRGRWWKTLLLILAGSLLAGIAAGAADLVIASVLRMGSDSRLVVFLVSVVAGIAGSLIATPYIAAFTTVLYFDLRIRKEASDVHILAERRGVEPYGGQSP
jgi:hypothetical protein